MLDPNITQTFIMIFFIAKLYNKCVFDINLFNFFEVFFFFFKSVLMYIYRLKKVVVKSCT